MLRVWREALISELTERLQPAAIIERVDRVYDSSKICRRARVRLVSGKKRSTIFAMNGIQFHFDALEARKPEPSSTSAKTTPPPPNTLTASPRRFFATKEALRSTSPHGCSRVTGVDSSRTALEVS